MQAVIERGAPARRIIPITPSDSTNFTDGDCRGIYVGTTGDVVVVPPTGNPFTCANVASGTVLPMMAIRVNATGTTATGLGALY